MFRGGRFMSSRKQISPRALTVAIGALLMAGAVQAQNATTQAATPADQGQNKAKTARPQGGESQQQATTLNQVVVTGNTNFGGIRKIDASYSITSMTSEQIKESNPISTADLLKMSPGIYPESSGGQTGANIEVAGFPSDSG